MIMKTNSGGNDNPAKFSDDSDQPAMEVEHSVKQIVVDSTPRRKYRIDSAEFSRPGFLSPAKVAAESVLN